VEREMAVGEVISERGMRWSRILDWNSGCSSAAFGYDAGESTAASRWIE
jgi:hypothetical protein